MLDPIMLKKKPPRPNPVRIAPDTRPFEDGIHDHPAIMGAAYAIPTPHPNIME